MNTQTQIISVILPTYNEAGNISSIVKEVFAQSAELKDFELYIVVVDDNSPDGTPDIVKKLQKEYGKLHFLTNYSKGLGDAYKEGITYSLTKLKANYIIQMDADGQHDPSLIPIFINLCSKGFDVVIGSRFTHGGSTPSYSSYRKIVSLAGNWLVRLLGGILKIHDCTSGFRCIKSEYIEKCEYQKLSSRAYSFQSSFLCELVQNSAKVIEVPITFPKRKFGSNKISIDDQLEFILNISQLRMKKSEEFIKFCFVGASGVIVNIGFYILLNRLLNIERLISYPLAIEVSIVTNFILNNYWSFKKRDSETRFLNKLLKFHIVSGIAGVLNFLIFLVFVRFIGLYDILASCLGIVVATLLNYVLNSFWTWPKKKSY